MRKVFVAILGFGAVLIVLLLGIFFYMSSTLKKNIQTSLNTHLNSIQENFPQLTYEPFVCKGIKEIWCQSPSLAWNDIATLKNVRFGVLKQNDAIRLSLESDNVHLVSNSFLNVFLSAIAPSVDFSEIVLPNSLQCTLDSSLKKRTKIEESLHDTKQDSSKVSQENPTLYNTFMCRTNAKNLGYEFTINAQEELASIGELHKLTDSLQLGEVLFDAMSAYQEDANAFMRDTRVILEDIILNFTPNNLSQTIVQKIAARETLDEQEYQKYYTQLTKSTQTAKSFMVYMLLLGNPRIAYKDQLVSSFDGLANMLEGHNNGIIYHITPKVPTHSVSLQDLIEHTRDTLNPEHFTLIFKEVSK